MDIKLPKLSEIPKASELYLAKEGLNGQHIGICAREIIFMEDDGSATVNFPALRIPEEPPMGLVGDAHMDHQ